MIVAKEPVVDHHTKMSTRTVTILAKADKWDGYQGTWPIFLRGQYKKGGSEARCSQLSDWHSNGARGQTRRVKRT
jgi:hypothetical protein